MGVILPIFFIPAIILSFIVSSNVKQMNIKNKNKHFVISLLITMFTAVVLIIVRPKFSYLIREDETIKQFLGFGAFFTIISPMLTYVILMSKKDDFVVYKEKEKINIENNSFESRSTNKELDLIKENIEYNEYNRSSKKRNLIFISIVAFFFFPLALIFLIPYIIFTKD